MAGQKAEGAAGNENQQQPGRADDILERAAKKKQEKQIAQQMTQAAVNEQGGGQCPPMPGITESRIPEGQHIVVTEPKRINDYTCQNEQPGGLAAIPRCGRRGIVAGIIQSPSYSTGFYHGTWYRIYQCNKFNHKVHQGKTQSTQIHKDINERTQSLFYKKIVCFLSIQKLIQRPI